MEVIKIRASVDEAMSMIGYQPKTTFWMDFSIADRFGIEAIIDTYERAFVEWHPNHIYLTELVSFGARLMSGRRRTCMARSCNTSTM